MAVAAGMTSVVARDFTTSRATTAPALVRLGLVRPRGGWFDRHVLIALAAGVATGFAQRAIHGAPVAPFVPGLLVVFGWLVVQPVIEEVLFRGVLQGALARGRLGSLRVFGVTAANVVASACFCIAHLAGHPPLWAAAVFVPSLVFGHLFDRSRSIVSGLVVHSAYNLVYLGAVAGAFA